ncbi:MAG: FGGY-family carbohydrate kinase [Spirochaetales bacterium]|jgi:xylulokinase|nr:FGGY-family carbohydrate kinase [Spirochaetales bacterium]
MQYIIAYDLGTGGLKTSLFDAQGKILQSNFQQCSTYYPAPSFREQKPSEWWGLLKAGTGELLAKSGINSREIVAAACSGHSLGIVPIGRDGTVLWDDIPIWTDARASAQAGEVFSRINELEWYKKTGSGFPPHLYSAFKILWYKQNKPELFNRVDKFIGTKDYLNLRLTGVAATDYSYASGSGVYDLLRCCYDKDYIAAFDLPPGIFPELYESQDILGTILPEAARELGLPEHLKVASGGVDNACMAAGAGCVEEGAAYTSLGTSAWIAVSSSRPVINGETKPYVFGHLIKGMYASAESIFSAGNTFRWVRDTLCPDLGAAEKGGGEDAYQAMDRLAASSSLGAGGLFFTPTLAGANALDKSLNAKGAIIGLDLKHTRADIIRAALEGVCLGLRMALEELKKDVTLHDEMLIVGGGSKSPYWRQLFADIYGMTITESPVGENAGSLGAMACAAVGAGLWKDFKPLIKLNKPISMCKCQSENKAQYDRIYQVFKKVSEQQSEIADFQANSF